MQPIYNLALYEQKYLHDCDGKKYEISPAYLNHDLSILYDLSNSYNLFFPVHE